MIETSALINRPVLSRAYCCIIGSVADVYYDENCKKIAYLALSQSNKNACVNFDGIMLLPFAEISGFSDAIVIADDAGLISLGDVDVTSLIHSLEGKSVYTSTGMFKGAVIGVKCTDGGKTLKICTADSDYSPANIGGFGDVVLLKSNTQGVRTKRKIPRPEKDYPVEMLNSGAEKKVKNPENAAGKSSEYSNTDSPSETYRGASSENGRNTENPNAQNPVSEVNYVSVAETDFSQNNDARFPEAKVPAENTVEQNVVSATKPIKADETDKANEFTDFPIYAAPPAKALSFGDDREPVFTKEAFEKISGVSVDAAEKEDAHTPTRIICDYKFLLGRKLTRDLKSYIGDLIAPEGAAVTDETVEKARRSGKLVELTLNSK